MTKEELIKAIETMLHKEETLISVYNHHLEAILQWCDCPEQKRTEIRAILTKLSEDSKHHKADFANLLTDVKGGKIDVY